MFKLKIHLVVVLLFVFCSFVARGDVKYEKEAGNTGVSQKEELLNGSAIELLVGAVQLSPSVWAKSNKDNESVATELSKILEDVPPPDDDSLDWDNQVESPEISESSNTVSESVIGHELFLENLDFENVDSEK